MGMVLQALMDRMGLDTVGEVPMEAAAEVLAVPLAVVAV